MSSSLRLVAEEVAETSASANGGEGSSSPSTPGLAFANFSRYWKALWAYPWLRSVWARVGLAMLGVVGSILAFDRLFPPPLHRAERIGYMVTSVEGVPLRAFPTADGRWRFAAKIDEIDPQFIEALIAVEDKRFYDHFGVDLLAVSRAIRSVVATGEVVSGASTITMQAARLLEPRPRNISSKLIEVIRAIQIESRLSKSEILELYLTLTPYGGNLEGIRAASLAYLGKEPERLAPEQIALLIALPQAPEARRPDRRPAAAKAARDRLLDKLGSLSLLSEQQWEESKSLPVPVRQLMPARGWHAADRATLAVFEQMQAARAKSAAPQPHRERLADIRSSLSFGLQLRAEQRVRDFVLEANRAEPGGTLQGAAIIVETQEMMVRSLVGSAGRDRPGGWLDLTDRTRSPGSTLKPFIYAFAFEDGLAGPQTRIVDLPQRFGAGYQPENFDRGFAGDVTIAEALQHSLNIPAVMTLDRIGVNRFANQMLFSGVAASLPEAAEANSGLALALGGVGMKMSDLAILYGALANEGMVKPLHWIATEPSLNARPDEPASANVRRLFGAQTAQEILTILKGTPAPEGRMPSLLTSKAPEIAYKTGTSYGFRDAWAAGVSGNYLVIVWIGRADGGARSGQTGRSDALPLLFSLFDDALTHDANASRIVKDERTDQKGRTRLSGRKTGPQILFPPAKSTLLAEDFGERSHGFVLAGQGDGPLAWFVDGNPVPRDAGGLPVWKPQGPGFYSVSVVDKNGKQAVVATRIEAMK